MKEKKGISNNDYSDDKIDKLSEKIDELKLSVDGLKEKVIPEIAKPKDVQPTDERIEKLILCRN